MFFNKKELWEIYKTNELDEYTICNKCHCDITNYDRIIFSKCLENEEGFLNYTRYRVCKNCFTGYDENLISILKRFSESNVINKYDKKIIDKFLKKEGRYD